MTTKRLLENARKKLDPDEVFRAAEKSTFGLESLGFCLICGEIAYGVEPDARKYTCECCGAHEVYGASECVLMGLAE